MAESEVMVPMGGSLAIEDRGDYLNARPRIGTLLSECAADACSLAKLRRKVVVMQCDLSCFQITEETEPAEVVDFFIQQSGGRPISDFEMVEQMTATGVRFSLSPKASISGVDWASGPSMTVREAMTIVHDRIIKATGYSDYSTHVTEAVVIGDWLTEVEPGKMRKANDGEIRDALALQGCEGPANILVRSSKAARKARETSCHWMPRPGVAACGADYPNMLKSDDGRSVTCMACLDVYFRRNENVAIASGVASVHAPRWHMDRHGEQVCNGALCGDPNAFLDIEMRDVALRDGQEVNCEACRKELAKMREAVASAIGHINIQANAPPPGIVANGFGTWSGLMEKLGISDELVSPAEQPADPAHDEPKRINFREFI